MGDGQGVEAEGEAFGGEVAGVVGKEGAVILVGFAGELDRGGDGSAGGVLGLETEFAGIGLGEGGGGEGR